MGDDADAAGPAKEPPLAETQAPEAFPTIPPPSKTVVEAVVPPVESPVPYDVPVIGLPSLDSETPPSEDRLPPVEDDIPLALSDDIPDPDDPDDVAKPYEDWGSEPPYPLHAGLTPIADPSGDVAAVNGLSPGDTSSSAPKGMPVGETGEAGPMPRGEVIPTGGDMPPTCATAAELETIEKKQKQMMKETVALRPQNRGLSGMAFFRSVITYSLSWVARN